MGGELDGLDSWAQWVVFNGSYLNSAWMSVRGRVLQESVLGPVAFSIFINNMEKVTAVLSGLHMTSSWGEQSLHCHPEGP